MKKEKLLWGNWQERQKEEGRVRGCAYIKGYLGRINSIRRLEIQEKGTGVEELGKSQQGQLVPMVTTRWQHQLGCCQGKRKEKAPGSVCVTWNMPRICWAWVRFEPQKAADLRVTSTIELEATNVGKFFEGAITTCRIRFFIEISKKSFKKQRQLLRNK